MASLSQILQRSPEEPAEAERARAVNREAIWALQRKLWDPVWEAVRRLEEPGTPIGNWNTAMAARDGDPEALRVVAGQVAGEWWVVRPSVKKALRRLARELGVSREEAKQWAAAVGLLAELREIDEPRRWWCGGGMLKDEDGDRVAEVPLGRLPLPWIRGVSRWGKLRSRSIRAAEEWLLEDNDEPSADDAMAHAGALDALPPGPLDPLAAQQAAERAAEATHEKLVQARATASPQALDIMDLLGDGFSEVEAGTRLRLRDPKQANRVMYRERKKWEKLGIKRPK